MSDSMTLTHLGGDRFAVEIRGHTITVDQPSEAGGDDTAPTPTELFVASLAACVAFYARRYLARHHLPTDGLSVTSSYTAAGNPNRITDIAIRITPPAGLAAERRDALLAVASHCTVHNTLHQPPAVHITIEAGKVARRST